MRGLAVAQFSRIDVIKPAKDERLGNQIEPATDDCQPKKKDVATPWNLYIL